MALFTSCLPIPGGQQEESRKTKVSLRRRPQVLELWQFWAFLKAHLDRAHPEPLGCLGNEANYQCASLWAAFPTAGWAGESMTGVLQRSISGVQSVRWASGIQMAWGAGPAGAPARRP